MTNTGTRSYICGSFVPDGTGYDVGVMSRSGDRESPTIHIWTICHELTYLSAISHSVVRTLDQKLLLDTGYVTHIESVHRFNSDIFWINSVRKTLTDSIINRIDFY